LSQKLAAFLAGVGVSALFFFYTLQQDVWESGASIESTLQALQRDAGASTLEMKQRLATVEHELATLKKDLSARDGGSAPPLR
jgi:hypothetical protein